MTKPGNLPAAVLLRQRLQPVIVLFPCRPDESTYIFSCCRSIKRRRYFAIWGERIRHILNIVLLTELSENELGDEILDIVSKLWILRTTDGDEADGMTEELMTRLVLQGACQYCIRVGDAERLERLMQLYPEQKYDEIFLPLFKTG